MAPLRDFFAKHAAGLKTAALVCMLLIPFFLYTAARHGSALQVKLLLGLMALNMLFVMLKG